MENEQAPVALSERVRLVRIQTFFKNAAGNPVNLLLTGAVSALLLRDSGVPESSLQVWFALVFLGSLTTILFEWYVKRIGLTQGNAGNLFRIRFVLGGAVCALFGATTFFLPDLERGTPQLYVFLITMSIVAVSYMSYATEFVYSLMVNVLTFMPFSVYCIFSFFSGGDVFFALVALATINWQIVVAIKAWRLSRSAIGEIEAREHLHDEMAERRLVEEALVAAEEQSQQLAAMLRLMCDNVPDMIWAKDHESRYTFVNKALCDRLLNASDTEEPLGKTFSKRHAPSAGGRARWMLRRPTVPHSHWTTASTS